MTDDNPLTLPDPPIEDRLKNVAGIVLRKTTKGEFDRGYKASKGEIAAAAHQLAELVIEYLEAKQ